MQTDRRDVKQKASFHLFFSSVLGGVRRGLKRGEAQSGSEGSGPGVVRIFVGFGVRLLAHPKNF